MSILGSVASRPDALAHTTARSSTAERQRGARAAGGAQRMAARAGSCPSAAQRDPGADGARSGAVCAFAAADPGGRGHPYGAPRRRSANARTAARIQLADLRRTRTDRAERNRLGASERGRRDRVLARIGCTQSGGDQRLVPRGGCRRRPLQAWFCLPGRRRGTAERAAGAGRSARGCHLSHQ